MKTANVISPSSSPRHILWQKWLDPIAVAMHNINLQEITDEEADYFAQNEELLAIAKVYAAVYTPAGVIPMHEASLPCRHFNWWMGHTNFRLTTQMVPAMENVDGAEAVDFISPYRFRLTVGKLFDEDIVMENMEKALCGGPSTFDSIVEVASKAYTFFAVHQMPNGRPRIVGGATTEEVRKKSEPLLKDAISSKYSWN